MSSSRLSGFAEPHPLIATEPNRKLKQRETAALLSIPQSKVSALKNYWLDQFSVETLMEFLTSHNQEMEP